MLEGEFFSGGHLRWNLGWPTPNYAGAFVVTVLVLLWIFSGSRWRWAALTIEACGSFLLAKTYSRGAVVAWGLASLFGVIAGRGWRVPAERLVWASRLAILAGMMFAAGFAWSRTADMKEVGSVNVDAREDGSVVNRLALWRGGLKMIAAAPLTGWGGGESGRVYMNWFQDPDRTEGYTTMVNSYLHVAVEYGLPALAAVLFGSVCLLTAAWQGARNGQGALTSRRLSLAAGASLVAWLTANIFTTLWIDPKLWIVPSLAIGALLWMAARRVDMRLGKIIRLSGVFAGLALLMLYGAGRWLDRNKALDIRPGANDTVWAKRGAGSELWHVWADPAVLGRTFGKELRRWLEQAPSDNLFVVHHAGMDGSREVLPPMAERVVLMGRQAERLVDSKQGPRQLWLVHPRGMPPFDAPGKAAGEIVIFLPEVDEVGDAPAWRRWAKESGASIVESAHSGLDIRALWPGILYDNR